MNHFWKTFRNRKFGAKVYKNTSSQKISFAQKHYCERLLVNNVTICKFKFLGTMHGKTSINDRWNFYVVKARKILFIHFIFIVFLKKFTNQNGKKVLLPDSWAKIISRGNFFDAVFGFIVQLSSIYLSVHTFKSLIFSIWYLRYSSNSPQKKQLQRRIKLNTYYNTPCVFQPHPISRWPMTSC